MVTFPYANVDQPAGTYQPTDAAGSHVGDPVIVMPGDLTVVDLDTGLAPVDAQGRLLGFSEVNAAEGWAIAYDPANWDNPRAIGNATIRITGRFELRYDPPK